MAKRKVEAQAQAVERVEDRQAVTLQAEQAEAVFALAEKRERIMAEANAQLGLIEKGLSGLASILASILGMPSGEGWGLYFENGEGRYEDKRPCVRLVAQKDKPVPVANPTPAPVAEQPAAEPAA